MRFDEFDLNYDILDALDDMGFSECTPVQEQSIGVALEGRDLIAIAQTGTGKTAAYLLPALDRIARSGTSDGIKCVVMVPTHELAQQIDRQLQGFSYFLPVSSVAIHGGTDGKEFARQQRGLKMGADIVIATPGRLIAHMQMNYVDLSHVEMFVLDEADRMLDMGFSDDIMRIFRKLPEGRQTLLYSATMPDKIRTLAKSVLHNPAEVRIAVSRPVDRIVQSAYICHEAQKTPILRHLFTTTFSSRVIVFASSKLKVKELTRELRRAGLKVGEMHSDLDQPTREQVMLDFRAGRIDILVATDIVARGIDIDDITMVVNYDVPHEAEDYVHRIGRTARANTDGKAVTLVSERDRVKFRDIERFLGYKVTRESIPDGLGGDTTAPDSAGRHSNRGGRRRNHGRGNMSSGQGKTAGQQPQSAQADTRHDDATAADSTTADGGTVKPRGRRRGGRRHGHGRAAGRNTPQTGSSADTQPSGSQSISNSPE